MPARLWRIARTTIRSHASEGEVRRCYRQLRGDSVILTGVSAVGEPLTAHQLLSLASLGLR